MQGEDTELHPPFRPQDLPASDSLLGRIPDRGIVLLEGKLTPRFTLHGDSEWWEGQRVGVLTEINPGS